MSYFYNHIFFQTLLHFCLLWKTNNIGPHWN